MEIFSGIRERSKIYDVVRLTSNILYPSDEIQKLMDELNPIEKVAIEVLQNANDMAY